MHGQGPGVPWSSHLPGRNKEHSSVFGKSPLYFQTSDPQPSHAAGSDKSLGGLGYLPNKDSWMFAFWAYPWKASSLWYWYLWKLTCQMTHDGTTSRMKKKFFQLTALSAAVKLSWLPVCKHQISARAGHASATPSRCHPAAPRQSTWAMLRVLKIRRRYT